MLEQSNTKPAELLTTIDDATIILRNLSVLTAEVDGEIVMMSIEQGRYFGLDDIGSDIWKRLDALGLAVDPAERGTLGVQNGAGPAIRDGLA